MFGRDPKQAEKDYEDRKRAINEAEDVARKNARIRHQERAIRIWQDEMRRRSGKKEPNEGENPSQSAQQFSLDSLGKKIGNILRPLGQSNPGVPGFGLGHNSLHPGPAGGALRMLSVP